MTIALKALKRLRYPSGPAGKEYQAGDSFDALSERDAKALTLVRAAQYDDKAKKPVKPKATEPQPLVTAGLKAEDDSTAGDQPRRYRRRDVVPEE